MVSFFYRIIRFMVMTLLLGMVAAFLLLTGGCGYMYYRYGHDLPDHDVVKEYEPKVITRLHAADGSLMAEFAEERRLFIPIDQVPEHVIQAFISAEDKDFYKHGGVDFFSIAKTMVRNVSRATSGQRLAGASTITQQVAKNFLIGDAFTVERKIREAFIAWRLERDLSKDDILELYLNEIYFGLRAYGLAEASLAYYDKAVADLTISEAAYLASVIKGPSNYEPDDPDELKRGMDRRAYVLNQMAENGYISDEDVQTLRDVVPDFDIQVRSNAAATDETGYFSTEAYRQLSDTYGPAVVRTEGLSVRTTMDPALQELAQRVLRDGLHDYDRRHGYRGPVGFVEISDWQAGLAAAELPYDILDFRPAAVLQFDGTTAQIGFTDGTTGTVPIEGYKWAKVTIDDDTVGRTPTQPRDVFAIGDVVLISARGSGAYNLEQIPEIEGALVALDPHTGRILALVGGYAYEPSRGALNRATQAERQPGSTFKPFVYLAAMEQGFSPKSTVLDNPWIIPARSQGEEDWRPRNYDGTFWGRQPLYVGLEWSRNLMTIRLANEVGMNRIVEIARDFGISDSLPPYLAVSLGTAETTLMDLTTAYGMLVNGGKQIEPALIDRVQDRYGRTLFRHEKRNCVDCNVAEDWERTSMPVVFERAEQVTTELAAYHVVSMLRGVVENGTAQRRVGKVVDRPVGGKTGTTQESKDAWFIGFSPDLVVGVYVGFDQPRSLGKNESGGKAASPIFAAFMNEALAGTPITQFRYPEGVKFSTIDPRTGVIDVRRVASDGRVIGDTGVEQETVQGTRGTSAPVPSSSESTATEDVRSSTSSSSTSSRSSDTQTTPRVISSDAIF
jgi:penicillin-binding protein 1A